MKLSAKVRVKAGSRRVVAEFECEGPLVIIGPNGAGKSTLLKALLGATRIEEGRVAVGDELLVDTSRGLEVALEQRRLGYLPQHPALFPHLSVEKNLAFALECRGLKEPGRVRETLESLGLEALSQRRPETLSGGEKQRVSLARALCARPRALLLDEPLASLDVQGRVELRSFLARLLKEQPLPTLVVTHDVRDARALGARVLVLEEGRVVQQGSLEELEARPASAFVEAFLQG